jgi:hypothetical protein
MEFSAPVVVVLAVMLMLAAVSVFAIFKYPQVDDFVKVMGVFTGLFGTVVGSASTYFFTREPLAAAQRQAASYKQDAEKLTAEVQQLRTRDVQVARAREEAYAKAERMSAKERIAEAEAQRASAKASAETATDSGGLRRAMIFEEQMKSLLKDVAALRKSIDSNSAATQKSLASLTEQAKLAAVSFAPFDVSYKAGQPYVGFIEPLGYKYSTSGPWSLPPCRN